MRNKIVNYKDILAEEKRLRSLLAEQKTNLQREWANTQMHLKPLENAVDFVSNVTTKNQKNPLLNLGIDLGVDVLLQRVLLGNAGFLTKLLVPLVVRNYSSNMLSNGNGKNIFSRIGSLFKKSSAKKEMPIKKTE